MLHTYYTKMRPPMPGAVPKAGLVSACAFDRREMIKEIGCEAWGAVFYDRELSAEEIAHYELASPEKPESMTISKVIPFDIEGTHFYAQLVGDGVNIYDGMTGDFLRDFDGVEEAFEWAEEVAK